MFDTFYVRMSDNVSVGPLKENQIDEARELIVAHPEYNKNAECSLVAYICPGDEWIISIESVRGIGEDK